MSQNGTLWCNAGFQRFFGKFFSNKRKKQLTDDIFYDIITAVHGRWTEAELYSAECQKE